jgi:hypothetical protein
MGRGRQKAKQTKVARELKYYTPNTDYDALQRELASGGTPYPEVAGPAEADDEDDQDDKYADWAPSRGH